VIPGVPNAVVQKIFGISYHTLKRTKKMSDCALFQNVSGYRTHQISFSVFGRMQQIVDDILPVKSGRNFRVLYTTYLHVYNKYASLAPYPVSYQHFMKYMHSLQIHHGELFGTCPHCLQKKEMDQLPNNGFTLEEASEFYDLLRHARYFPLQLNCYHLQKSHPGEGQMIITMDFTKIDLVNHYFQDLVVCITKKPPGQNIQQFYLHFLGQKREKNDVHFTLWVWKYLQQNNYFVGTTSIKLWTDGGPRHFKTSSHIYFLSHFQADIGIPFTYNFFASYHGSSVCDAVAAQAKEKIKEWMAENRDTIHSNTVLAEIIGKLTGHYPIVLPALERYSIVAINT